MVKKIKMGPFINVKTIPRLFLEKAVHQNSVTGKREADKGPGLTLNELLSK